MIPKKIHYCWFGGHPLPELAIKCIHSWKKYCPDYQVIEWNESNFDISCCQYVKEAYQAEKWAFVSDYARFQILYKEGGLYFDTDVEMIKPIDDIVLRGPFMGIEQNENFVLAPGVAVAPGLGLAATPGLGLYKELLDMYQKMSFYHDDGALNQTTVVMYTTQALCKHGLAAISEIQTVAGINIYPKDYFCPLDDKTGKLIITENTRTIHHFAMSWISPIDQKWHRLEQKLVCMLGKTWGHRGYRILDFPYRVLKKVKQKGLKNTIAFSVKKLKNGVRGTR